MTTAYTSLLGLALPVTGELSGTWGDTVNNSITSLLDSAIAGTQTLTADTTLTTTTGAANQSRQAILLCSPASANITITAPAQSKIYTVINTSATYTVKICGVGPTTGVTLGVSEKAVVAWNGSDFVRISNTGGAGVFTSITNSGLTSGRVVYSTTGGLETDSANLTFNGTTLTANTIGAFTLSGTVAGGGNQINNVIIGTTTPLAGSFTTLTSNGATTFTAGTVSTTTGTGTLVITGGLGVSGRINAANFDGIIGANTAAAGAFTSLTASTTLGVTGVSTLTAGAVIQGLTVGRGAGAVATNTAVGASALAANTTGTENTAIGASSLLSNTTGNTNTAIGINTLRTNISGQENTALGHQVLYANTGSYNTGAGTNTLRFNTSGANNTAFGYNSLFSSTTANNNTAVGYQAGYSNTTGTTNTALGTQALNSNTTASNNTAVGYQAFYSNTVAAAGVAVGYQAGYSQTNPDRNVAIGFQSMYSNVTGYPL